MCKLDIPRIEEIQGHLEGGILENQIICADAIAYLKTIPNNSIPLILTDIPYGVVNRESSGIRDFDKKDADEVNFDINALVEELERVSSGSIYIFCSTEQVSFLRGYFAAQKMTTRLCIWEKTNPSPVNCQHFWLNGIETCVFARKSKATFNEHYKNCVWKFPNGKRTFHPTQKPLKLFEYLIETSSNEGDLVLDPFSGSGTTALAASKLNRKFLCIDQSEEYVELSKKRLTEGK